MTSLTRAKRVTKFFALGTGAALAALLVVRIVFAGINLISVEPRLQNQLNAPTLTFGQIDAPRLPRAEVTTEAATLQLDLVNGNFPQSTATATVYRAADSSLSLSARDRARAKATNLGFTVEPEQPTPSTFRWSQNNRTMELELSNQTFTFTQPTNTITFNNRQEFSRFSPIGTLTSRFIQSQFQYTDLLYDDPDVQYVNPIGQEFIPQSSNAVQPTNYAQATFLRRPINEIPIYSAAGKFGPISMVIVPATIPENNRDNTSTLHLDQIVKLQNNYIPIQMDQSATYPLITAEAAYTELQANLSRYLVSVLPTNSSQPASSFMGGRVLYATLAYLEPDKNNPDYVQPVWMFEGRGTTDVGNALWVAYVPAIDQALVNSYLLGN